MVPYLSKVVMFSLIIFLQYQITTGGAISLATPLKDSDNVETTIGHVASDMQRSVELAEREIIEEFVPEAERSIVDRLKEKEENTGLGIWVIIVIVVGIILVISLICIIVVGVKCLL